MSDRISELWIELFGRKITRGEHALLEGVDQKVGSDTPVLILAALMIRMQYLVLVENPDSPLRTVAAHRRSLEEHTRSVAQISETYRILRLNLSEWNGMLARTERDIDDLHDLARSEGWRRILEMDDGEDGASPKLFTRLLVMIWGGTFISGALGVVTAMVLLR